jgi:hypothetical protein
MKNNDMNGIVENIKKNAQLVAGQLNLNFDEPSIKVLEGFIERQRERMGEKGIDGLINTLGSYLGECIIRNYGGHWENDTDGSPYIQFDEKNGSYPFSKVRKQFKNGLEDSIYSFYTQIPTVFSEFFEQLSKRRDIE